MENPVTSRENISSVHDQHDVSCFAFRALLVSLALAEVAIFSSVRAGWFWLTVPLVLLTAHLMHGVLIGFHEAAHGLLLKSRRMNEVDGLVIGFFSFLPFSLYRVLHQMHHMHLATEKDIELWPFVLPGAPRWARRMAAFLELTCSLFYSPFIFLRVFFRHDSLVRNPKVRRRVWLELIVAAVVWAGILAAIAFADLWKYFFCLYLVPALFAANLQSWRKYIEHVGLTGNTVNSSTRSIVPRSRLGRIFATTLLHEPYHGVHHQDAALPHSALPEFAAILTPQNPGEPAPFMSYRQALPEVFRSLVDPRVGAQWRDSLGNRQPSA